MQYTDRLNLRKPDQDDAYQVDDFNANFQRISEAFAGVPTLTNYFTLEDFFESGNAGGLKKGDTVAINNLIYILVGNNPLSKSDYMVYGAEAIVVMNDYVNVSDRINGSLYFQPGKTRGLIILTFNKFFRNLFKTSVGTSVSNEVAFSIVNGEVSTVGTASGDVEFYLGSITLYANTPYDFRGCPFGGSESTFYLEAKNGNTSLAVDTGSGASYTPTEDVTVDVYIKIASGCSTNDLVFVPRFTVISGCTGGNATTLYMTESTEKSANTEDGNVYRFTCKNLTSFAEGDVIERSEGKIYFKVD